MAGTFQAGKLLREGLKVVFAGRPNVGKSSIFNALIGQERAIVTEIAGTTRDSLHETLSIKGIPVSLVDTAGLRETFDRVESIGVDRTKQIVADSDLVIVVIDGSQALTPEDQEILNDTKGLSRLIAINKIDLDGNLKFNFSDETPILRLSAKTSEGMNELQSAIVEPFLPNEIINSGFLISDARHFDLITRAQLEIEQSLKLIDHHSEEITLIGLHNAIRLLGEITGETTAEDVLTRIFSTFCIGK
jgi:tRNA modification GTPase